MAKDNKQPDSKPAVVEGIKKEAGVSVPASRNAISKPKTSDTVHGVKRDRQ